MKRPSFAALALAILSITVPGITAPGQIQWAKSLDDALDQAKRQNKIVFIAMNMDGERANDRIAAVHYRDGLLAKLSSYTVNLFCSNDIHKKSGSCPRCKGTRCAQHRDNDIQVRKRILKLENDDPILPPVHLFVAADGKILTSVSKFVTAGELEWMWVDAIRELQPNFDWSPSESSRAPEHLQQGAANTTKLTETPPSDAKVKQALKDIKKVSGGRRNWRRMLRNSQKNSRVIIRSDDKRALDWGRDALRSYRQFSTGLLRDIGRLSPRPWSGVIVEWLADKSADKRKTTAIALEQLANPKSVNALITAVRREKEIDVLGRMLRALAWSGPTKRNAITTVTKIAKSHKFSVARAHAVVAVGKLEKREPITTALRAALQDPDPMVRSVAAYVIAIRQDRDLMQHLHSSTEAETNTTAKAWMAKAIEAVKTGNTKPFEGFLTKVLDGDDPGSPLDRLRKMAEGFGDDSNEKKD